MFIMDQIETTVVRFRTAFNGFNKKDVSQYVSQTATAHGDAMKKLSDQLRQLEQENEELRRAVGTDSGAEIDALRAELAALQEENGLLKNRVRQLEFKLEEATESTVETVSPPCPVEAASVQEKELEAYRRAESMERRISQRAQHINNQLQDITTRTTSQLTDVMDSAKSVLSMIESQITVLQNTTDGFDNAMAESLAQVHSMTIILPDISDTE